MRALLIFATIVDLALAALLVAISGFVLQGVNNTGPMMPEAIFYILMIVVCVLAPVIAWSARGHLSPGATVVTAFAPIGVAALVLIAEPLFV